MESLIEALLELDPKLRRIAARIAGDPAEADDLVQEVWLAVLTRWPGAACALEPWALAVMRNQAARRVRRSRPADTRMDLDQLEASTEASPVELLEARRQLSACIETLQEPYRSILIERFYASRSVGEIAAARGVSRATVATQLRRAMERLRARLLRRGDLFGLLPHLSWLRRPRSASIEVPAPLVARSFAWLLVVAPLAAVLAWARIPDPHAVDSELSRPLSVDFSDNAAHTAPETRSNRVALEFEAHAPLDPVRVEVRDALTSQPLAFAAISVRGEAGAIHERTCDEHGECRLPAELGAQWLVVGIAAAPVADLGSRSSSPSAPSIFRAFAKIEDGKLSLRYRRGPTLLAHLLAPRGMHPAELVYGLRSVRPGAINAPRLAVGPSEQGSVYTIQLPAEWSALTNFDELDLHGETPDGLLAANARISADALALREILNLEFEPTATLNVHARTTTGTRIGSGAIFLKPSPGTEGWVAPITADGRARIGGLRPGDYLLEVSIVGELPWSRELRLIGGVGEFVIAELVDKSLAEHTPIHGRIVRGADSYDGAIVVALEGGKAPQFRQLSWTACSGGFEARFEFPDVDCAHSILRPIAIDGFPEFDPPIVEDAHGGAGIEIACRGRRSATAIRCDVRSSDSDEPVAGHEFEFELPGQTVVYYRALEATASEGPRWSVSSHGLRWKARSGSPWDWCDRSSSVRWKLHARGFEDQSGDESAWSSGVFSARLIPSPRLPPIAVQGSR